MRARDRPVHQMEASIVFHSTSRSRFAATCLVLGIGLASAPGVYAASATEIDIEVNVAIERFKTEVGGGKEFLAAAKGVLVFPSVIKAGFGIGGEYGEGALRIKGKTVDYYSTAAASIGFQIGAQSKTLLLVFLQADALKSFRAAMGWKAGVDGSVALVNLAPEVPSIPKTLRIPSSVSYSATKASCTTSPSRARSSPSSISDRAGTEALSYRGRRRLHGSNRGIGACAAAGFPRLAMPYQATRRPP